MAPLPLRLVTGVLGYHYIAELPWIDALLNASMILGGMGPVDPLRSDGAKIFASLYALFSGERGLKIPSLTTLIRLAFALKCKVSALVTVFDREDLAKLLPK